MSYFHKRNHKPQNKSKSSYRHSYFQFIIMSIFITSITTLSSIYNHSPILPSGTNLSLMVFKGINFVLNHYTYRKADSMEVID